MKEPKKGGYNEKNFFGCGDKRVTPSCVRKQKTSHMPYVVVKEIFDKMKGKKILFSTDYKQKQRGSKAFRVTNSALISSC